MALTLQKAKKATIARDNSINAMSGMHNYSQNGRVYQSEKYSGPLAKRASKILPPEEKKRMADEETTVVNIKKLLHWFDGEEKKKYSDKWVEETYHLNGYYGDSAEVFRVFCENYPQAKFYKGWGDIFNSYKNHNPVRTEPMKTIKFKCEEHFAIDDCKPIYKVGDDVYCLIIDDGRFNPYKAKVISYYIKELSNGTFDIMYELRSPRFDGSSGWKLQGNGTVFPTLEDAVKGAKVKNGED